MKKVFTALFSATLLLLSINSVDAALVTISEDGSFNVNVLSITQPESLEVPKNEGIEVKRMADEQADVNSSIALSRNGESFELSISDGVDKKTLNVTSYEEEVLEIEERPRTQRISVKIENGKFILNQDEVKAETEYDINVDPKSASLTLKTPSGHRFLSILPREAVDSVLRANILDDFENIVLREGNDGILAYEIEGERVLNIFDIFDYQVPVSSRVSASTAEIIDTDQPKWLNFVGFIFS